MLSPFLFYEGEGEDVGVIHLLHVNSDVMVSLMICDIQKTYISIQILFELEWKRPTHRLAAKKIIAIYILVILSDLKVELFW